LGALQKAFPAKNAFFDFFYFKKNIDTRKIPVFKTLPEN